MPEKTADSELTALPSLSAILELLAIEPGHHLTTAGGNDLMVALSAGRLPDRPLLSLQHLTELRFIAISNEAITIGAGTTFSDLRAHPIITREFALLAHTADQGITQQDRGTLGGSIVSASPVADSPSALLVYDAELTLISSRGRRLIPFGNFYAGSNLTILQPDELLQSITLKRRFSRYIPYVRKVGARGPQATSQLSFAALALMNRGVIEDMRLGTASLRDIPVRLVATEQALRGRSLSPETIALARTALLAETGKISGVRSSSAFRSAIAVNLLEEFLNALSV